jgi:hypothetical protein
MAQKRIGIAKKSKKVRRFFVDSDIESGASEAPNMSSGVFFWPKLGWNSQFLPHPCPISP